MDKRTRGIREEVLGAGTTGPAVAGVGTTHVNRSAVFKPQPCCQWNKITLIIRNKSWWFFVSTRRLGSILGGGVPHIDKGLMYKI